jgi:rhodanese-related sulfurtransferase
MLLLSVVLNEINSAVHVVNFNLFFFLTVGELAEVLQSSPETFEKNYGVPHFTKDSPLVFSCRSGMRSRKAMGIATELGFTK